MREEVTSEPCIAEKRDPPNIPATPAMWNGCMRILCSAWKTNIKLNVPEMPNGIPSLRLPCPKGYMRKTAKAAETGAE